MIKEYQYELKVLWYEHMKIVDIADMVGSLNEYLKTGKRTNIEIDI